MVENSDTTQFIAHDNSITLTNEVHNNAYVYNCCYHSTNHLASHNCDIICSEFELQGMQNVYCY